MALQWKPLLRQDGDLLGKVDGEDVGDIKSGSQAGTAAKDITDDVFDNNILKEDNAAASLKNSAITLTAADGIVTLNNAGTGSFNSSSIGLGNVLNQAQTSTFRQAAVPTALAAGDIWYDTDDENKSYYATAAGDNEVKTGEWEVITLSATGIGLGDVLDQPQTSTFRQDDCPTALAAGDVWYDTNDEMKSYRATTAGDAEVASGKWEAISITKTGIGLGEVLDQPQTSTFRQDDVPTALAAGDIWYDTDDENKSYCATAAGDNEAKTGEWEVITLSKEGIGLGGVLDQPQTSTFRQDDCPTALAAGDIWYDTNDENNCYTATAAGDDAVGTGEWEKVTLTKTGIGLGEVLDQPQTSTFRQDTCPTALAEGDIWYDTSDENKSYTSSSAGDDAVESGEWEAITLTKTGIGLGEVLDQAQTSTFRQDDCPTALAAGDIWYDTNDENKSYRATAAGDDAVTSGEWEAISISKGGVGLGDVLDQPQTSTFRQDDVPTALAAGDIWFDTDNENKSYCATAAGDDAVESGKWEAITLTKTGIGLGDVLDQAQTSTFRQDACPTALAAGDIWYDTNDENKSYRATAAGDDAVESGEWEAISISKSGIGLGDVLDQAQTSTFRQDDVPTALAAGDIWIDTDDNNKSYTATTAGDNEAKAGEWEAITLTKTGIGLGDVLDQAQTSTFRQDACPVALAAGDIWYDTDDENKSYRATTAGDDAVTSGEWEAISISKSGIGLGNVIDQEITVAAGKLKFGATAQTLDADKIGGSTLAETKAAAVTTATSNIIGDAPDALNTLNELAAALGDDASYASTVTTALGARQMGHVGMTAADTPAATSYSVGRTGTFGGVMYMVVDE